MPKLVFIDILRMVSPGVPLEYKDFDFYALGSFDAIRIEQNNIVYLHELHDRNLRMHIDIPTHFDKQPLYLYAADRVEADDIFSIRDGYAVKPMVLTLIQLDDFSLKIETPEKIITFFEEQVRRLINEDSALQGIEFQAFYSLGESDVVLVLRDERLERIGRLLFRMRVLEDNGSGVCVLSMCSHCAFPKANNENALNQNIASWLEKDANVGFFTMTDTSYGLNNNWSDAVSGFLIDRYLLGEWDYCHNWPENQPEQNAGAYVRDVLCMLHAPDADQRTQRLRTAYTVPMIPLSEQDKPYAISRQRLSCVQTREDALFALYQEPGNQFEKAAQMVLTLSDLYSPAFCTEFSEKISSMHMTLTGIVKHLLNLRDGRFQQDLFAFIQPAFKVLPDITEKVFHLVEEYHWKKQEESVAKLLDNYIHDTSRLLSELQHLFSVLSVSPHTFLETYGSNMRSIAATCKLLVAYQGIANNISEHFDLNPYKEVFLVFPYRSIIQETRVLYDAAKAGKGIAYIRINFADMFMVPKTLFLLLHECGHTILPLELRPYRIRYFFQVVIAYLVHRTCFSHYYMPYKAIQVPLYGQEVNIDNYDKVRIKSDPEHIVIDYFKRSFREICVEEAKKMWDSFLSELHELSGENLSREFYFIYLVNYAQKYIDNQLLKDTFKAEKGSRASRKDAVNPESRLYKLYQALLGKCVYGKYKEIVEKELKDRRCKDDPELWCFAALNACYCQASDILLEKNLRNAVPVISAVYKNACREFREIFSDIYSDMFAFYMLRLDEMDNSRKRNEAIKYIELLADHAGFLTNTEFKRLSLLVRVLNVLICCYEIPTNRAVAFLVDNLPLEGSVKTWVEKKGSEALGSIYYPFIEEYAKLCHRSIVAQRNSYPALHMDTVWLNRLYTSADSKDPDSKNKLGMTVRSIHHFWMESTQRQGGT